MSSKHIISIADLKTFAQGALGAMTFGMYHQYVTNRIIDINIQQIRLENKYEMDKQRKEYEYDMDKQLEKQRKEYEREMNELRKEMYKRRWW